MGPVRMFVLLFGSIFFLASIGIIAAAVDAWQTRDAFIEDGLTVQGQFLQRYSNLDDEGDLTYWVRYRYTIDDVGYTHDESVSSSLYADVADLQEFDPITVTYLPDDPDTATLRDPADNTDAVALTIVAVCWNVGIIAFWLFFWWIVRYSTFRRVVSVR